MFMFMYNIPECQAVFSFSSDLNLETLLSYGFYPDTDCCQWMDKLDGIPNVSVTLSQGASHTRFCCMCQQELCLHFQQESSLAQSAEVMYWQ